MVKAQEWLDKKYPLEKRSKVKKLNISDKNLERHLDLSDFVNLEELDCGKNFLTSLDLSQNAKLKLLIIDRNNFPEQDLSFLSHLVDLEILDACGNSFIGSLEILKNMTKLDLLDISGTNIDSGLEFLPESINHFDCSSAGMVHNIYNSFADEGGVVETVRKEAIDIEAVSSYQGHWVYYIFIKNFTQKLKAIKEKVQTQKLLEFGGNLQKLLEDAKNRIDSRSKDLLDMLLETQTDIVELDKLGKNTKEQESFLQELKGSLVKKGLSKDKIETICQKQKETVQLKDIAELSKFMGESEEIIFSFQGLRIEENKEQKKPELEAKIEQVSSDNSK